ncbi:hypothetical protein [Helicobacter suis]|nr:hypothetical protein [Helicobacter suis]
MIERNLFYKRIVTMTKIVKDRELSKPLLLEEWEDVNNEGEIKEWGNI